MQKTASRFLLVIVAACLFGCGERPEPASQADLLITGATVIDPGSKQILDGASIAIADGRIVALGKVTSNEFEATRTIDASGKFILPAFTDMHVHWGNGTFAEDEHRVERRDELEICLRAGVDAAAHSIITGPFDADLHRQMGDSRFYYVVTLDLYDGFLNWSANPNRLEDAFLRETVTDKEAASMKQAPQIFAREREFFRANGFRPILDHVREAHAAGTVLLTGTDTGIRLRFPDMECIRNCD